MKKVSCPVCAGTLALILAGCPAPQTRTASPVIDPPAGTYLTSPKITITCSDPDAMIYFTTNGAVPGPSSLPYRADIPVSGNGTVITAIAISPGLGESEPVSAQYVVTWTQYPPSGEFSLYISLPWGITLDSRNGIVWTNCTSSGGVTYMDNMEGENIFTTGGYNNPTGIAADTANGVYFMERGGSRIISMVSGTETYTYGSYGLPAAGAGRFNQPGGVAWRGDASLLILDSQNNRIVSIDDMDGANWATFDGPGAGDYQLASPQGIALGPGNVIYVADTGNNRITCQTGPATDWAACTEGPGGEQFSSPIGIAVDTNGRIYVADTGNNRIVRMNDISGDGWTAIGSAGTGPGQFQSPSGIAVDAQGLVYVADTGNNRIVRLRF